MTPAEFRAARKCLGLTQAALAKRLGIRRATISDYERGVFPVPVITELAMQLLVEHPEMTKDGGI